LTAKLKLKLKRNWKETSTNRIRYTVSLTRDTQTQENYKLNLSNRFNIPAGERYKHRGHVAGIKRYTDNNM